jgi:hypothetical protein
LETMAIFTPGIAVGHISGAVGGDVFSHNRGGPYIRRRAVPVTSTTTYALAAKNRVNTLASRWKGLTDGQRLAWTDYARQNPTFNRLGLSITLLGLNAYIKLNSRLLAAGLTISDDPPSAAAPDGLLTLSVAMDIGAGGCEITFTPATLGADEGLWYEAAVVDSAGINFVRPYQRFISAEAAATASPVDPQTDIEARLGTLVVGQTVHIFAGVIDVNNGQLSGFLRDRAVVVST